MMMRINTYSRIWMCVVICIATNLNFHCTLAIVMKQHQQHQQHTTTSRRTLLSRIPFAIIGSTSAVVLSTINDGPRNIKYNNNSHNDNCSCPHCVQHFPFNNNNNNNLIVNAYERRDVGDENSSAETKAMNDQAYETNNRLERDGFKLDTAEEQSATLTAALSEYSYSPTSSTSSSSTSKASRNNNKNNKKSKEQ